MKLEPLGFRHYVDGAGKLLGAFGGTRRTNDDGAVEDLWPDAPPGGTLVSTPPPDANTKRVWNGTSWNNPAPTEKEPSAADLLSVLLEKGVVTPAELDAKKSAAISTTKP